MPASDTICISFGNWIVAFYAVYALAAIALVSALAIVIEWSVNRARASRVASGGKVSRRAQVVQSRA